MLSHSSAWRRPSLENGRIGNIRLALGGIAPKPWRAREAERSLVGAEASRENFRRAADAELAAAHGYRDNTFKIELARRTISAVLEELVEREGKQ